MNNTINYFKNIDEVIDIHNKTVEISGGGAQGILNLNSLEACLELMKNDEYYPTFIDKLTHLVFVANKSHSFQDGNKRIAIALGMKFLLNNGYLFFIQRFASKMEIISYQLAASRIDKNLLRDIISSILTEEDYSEELKIRIKNSIDS